MVRRGLTASGVLWAFKTTTQCNWHPLTWISHMLDVSLYGLNPSRHHLTSLLFHLLNVLLLFYLLKTMSNSVWFSGISAALFAVHPLHIESVAWVSERKDVLSTFLGLLSILAYVGYVYSSRSSFYVLCVLGFILSLMAKPMLVTLPVLLLLLDYWPLRRFESVGKVKLIIEKLPLVIFSIGSGIITFIAQSRGRAVGSLEELPLVFRVENALIAYVKYVLLTLWPRGIAIFYPHPVGSIPAWQVMGAFILLAGITFLAFQRAKTHPCFLVGWLWYLIALLPVIGLVQVGRQAMADRYTYVPLIGLFMAASCKLFPLVSARDRWRREKSSSLSIFMACVIVLAFALSTSVQVRYWSDSVSIFTRAIAVTRRNALAHTHLGLAFIERGMPDQAIEHYRAALRINPDYVQALVLLGSALAEKGDLGESERLLRKAISLDPTHPDGQNNLGAVLEKRGLLDEAFIHYQEAIKAKPDFAEAHANLGALFVRRRMFDDAEREFLEAIRITPNIPSVYYNLGVVYDQLGRSDEAISAFKKALELQPDLGEAHAGLAVVYYWQGKYEEAWQEVKEARRLGVEPPPGLVAALERRIRTE